MRRSIVILLALLAPLPLAGLAQRAEGPVFDEWFEGRTMRFDYHHGGDAGSEEFFFADLHEEPVWAGSRRSLIDENDYGNQRFRVLDAATGRLIYSRGYGSLWDEWQTTAEAKLISKSMPETVVFPMPKRDVRLELWSRGQGGDWVKRYEQAISPRSHFIAKYPPRYETFDVEVHGGDPAHTVDIVLLPEGYTEGERGKFEAACGDFAKALFSYSPFRELRDKFDLRAVWAPSHDSGVTMPGAGVWRNTSAGASFWTFDSERYQMAEDMHALRDQAGHVPYELIYILSNTDKYGGGGIYNYYAISSAGPGAPSRAQVYVHEFGHLLLGLGDEYVGGVSYDELSIYPPDREPWEVNLTTLVDFESKAWSGMLPAGTPVPTPVTPERADVLGVYEGGGYSPRGVYRPWPNCMMNSLSRATGFCPVCTKGIRDQIEFLCR